MQIIRSKPRWWSCHTHSRYSTNDALPSVEDLVAKAAELGHAALGLTDHGNMAGSVELYQECRKHGIKAFPGTELYFVPDIAQHRQDYANHEIKASRYHLGALAYNEEGYRNLVHLNTTAHLQHFHKPLVDFTTLAQLAQDGRTTGLAITTGCFFGYAAQILIREGEVACERFLATLESWFPGSVYVELQNHNIDHGDGCDDSLLADELQGVADHLGLPTVLTQDSHYLDPGDSEDHEALKRLVAFGPEADDAVFPGDGFHLADDRWIRNHHRADRLERGLEGLEHLLDRHGLRIPVLDSYAYSVPRVVADPQGVLLKRVWDEFNARDLSDRYKRRLKEECEVILAAGMEGYMLLVAMVTDYMKENDVVFQTRGSAAGSLVCFLLGITNADPLTWDLRFERFLSRDRTKPPDIDLDIAHDRRQEILDWLNTKFAAHQIGTWALYGLKADEEEAKGSLLKRYFSRNKYREEEIKNFTDIPVEDRRMLYRLSDRKLYSGMGKNAAGVVITSTKAEFDALVPLHHMNSGTLVSQYSKDFIEALGLVKLDVLGSKTLTVLQLCMQSMNKTVADLDDIPLTDKATFSFLRKGDMAGVFQLEGWTSEKGIKRLKPTHIRDVIAAMALFRPATMKSGGTDAYINRKNKIEKVPERHPTLNAVTKETYGVLLYQEQVIDILRSLGMDADNLTKFLKAVKASNKDIGSAGAVIEGYRGWLETQMIEKGFGSDDQKFVDEAIAGFAEYGFNRAHATVYGITAFRCAWLVVHQPLHFHAALLAVAAGEDDEDHYLVATKRRSVRISKADVNASGSTYRVDERTRTIRRGLKSITGVGEVSAVHLEEHQPYADFDDLLARTTARPISGRNDYLKEIKRGHEPDLDLLGGVLGALRRAGALAGILNELV